MKKKRNLPLENADERPEFVEEEELETPDEEILEASEAEDAVEMSESDEASDDLAIWNEEEETIEEEVEAAPEAEQALEGTELEGFESAEIEDVVEISDERLNGILEAIFFATDKPVSVAQLRQLFKGTNIKSKEIRAGIERFASDLVSENRGITLEEVSSGHQLRTKLDHLQFIRQSVKARPFRLSGPALEVMSIVAYKQPVTKAQIDEIRGVESGHLLRALMEKNLVLFGEKSELPGKPMYYETSRKFLEIFGLRNIRELPSLQEIDQLIPEGIGDIEEKETLGDLTDQLSEKVGTTYSEGEEELLDISNELNQITTSSDFFEQEKQRMREKRDQERAQDTRERIALGETVDPKDLRWLERFDEIQIQKAKGVEEVDFVVSIEEVAPQGEIPK